MVIKLDETMEILKIIAEKKDMKVTMKESFKGAACSAAGTLGGALVGGKEGMLLGGLLGATLGYFLTNDFKSVVVIISELPENEKRILYQRAKNIFESFQVEDVASAMSMVNGDHQFLMSLAGMLRNYVEGKQCYTVIQ